MVLKVHDAIPFFTKKHVILPKNNRSYCAGHILCVDARGSGTHDTMVRTRHLVVAPIVHMRPGYRVSHLHYLTLSILGYENFTSRSPFGSK